MSGQHETPADPALIALQNCGPDRTVALLHSGRSDPRWARRSLIGSPVGWFRHHPDDRGELIGDLPDIALTGKPLADLRTILHHPDLPGRWVGYISYEINRAIEPAKLGPPRPTAWPLIELGYCPDLTELPAPKQARDAAGPPATDRDRAAHRLQSNFTPDAYRAAVRRVIDYIAAGDVFQVNLAQRFATDWQGDPRALFQRLAHVSPAWYGAYLELPPFSRDPEVLRRAALPPRALLSTSPELFLQVENNHAITRPIKGTRKARNDAGPPAAGRDDAFENLRTSEKDAAELNMIIDLMRNDLGRVCTYGSVKVTQPRTIETHPTVHHGVATIEGDLHPRKDVVDLLRATLPGGSITGAPKVRAMQIIDELEPDPRGPYTGCIGWITRDACQFNIAIRTMVLERRADQAGLQRSESPDRPPPRAYHLSFHVGGGVVADSEPDAEYHETLDKAQAMLRALEDA